MTSAIGKGFTLLELLVVLAIIAIVSATVPIGFSHVASGVQVRRSSEDLADALRVAGAQALKQQHAIAVKLQGSPCRLQYASSTIWTCPPFVDVNLRTMLSAPGDVLTIYPDGSSSGADFTLTLHGHRAVVHISPMTSRVTSSAS